MIYLMVMSAVLLVLAGTVGGFFLRKRSTNWCPHCGATLRCNACTRAPTRTA